MGCLDFADVISITPQAPLHCVGVGSGGFWGLVTVKGPCQISDMRGHQWCSCQCWGHERCIVRALMRLECRWWREECHYILPVLEESGTCPHSPTNLWRLAGNGYRLQTRCPEYGRCDCQGFEVEDGCQRGVPGYRWAEAQFEWWCGKTETCKGCNCNTPFFHI